MLIYLNVFFSKMVFSEKSYKLFRMPIRLYDIYIYYNYYIKTYLGFNVLKLLNYKVYF